MNLNSRPLSGGWDDGVSLDRHIVSSDFLGYNEYGHPLFDTKRTELGELLYRRKYRADRSAIAPIAQEVRDFVLKWQPSVEVIVPTLPSRKRLLQPVPEIASEAAKLLGIAIDQDSVRKIKETAELKNVEYAKRLELLAGAYSVEADNLRGKEVLLLDDLYQSGATLNAFARVLREAGAARVFVLALTRARG